ncbi:MAG: DUF1328 domain-containing protein [Betaproteobacteria bacterium]|nr:MAG: DUF1328 domain-containing protein [Betaproteobacteria bacterium]
MFRYILAFSFLAVLAAVACAAVIAADAPAVGQIAFIVWLGLFVASLISGVTDRPRQRAK